MAPGISSSWGWRWPGSDRLSFGTAGGRLTCKPRFAGSPLRVAAGPATGVASAPLMPLAIGFAVFRHRLYDIDRFLRRALLWLSLSAFVAVLYLAVAVPAGLVASRTAGALGGVVVIIGVAL